MGLGAHLLPPVLIATRPVDFRHGNDKDDRRLRGSTLTAAAIPGLLRCKSGRTRDSGGPATYGSLHLQFPLQQRVQQKNPRIFSYMYRYVAVLQLLQISI